jgi:hypothetical protein
MTHGGCGKDAIFKGNIPDGQWGKNMRIALIHMILRLPLRLSLLFVLF